MADLTAAQAKNAELKAQLATLKGGASEPAASSKSAATKGKLAAIDLMKDELSLQQKIEQKELMMKQLHSELSESKADLQAVRANIDAARNSGQAVWESIGPETISYRDPFHTGLSKRTPTGGYFTS